MKILNLSTVHRWNDPRIFYKIASSLADRHEVVHAAVGDGEVRQVQGVTVKPLGVWHSRWDRPKLWWRAYREMLRSEYDVIHFHDPELALLLIPYALLGNKKLICDIHEHPEAAIGGREWIPRPIRKAVATAFSLLLRKTPYLYDKVILAEERYAPLFPTRVNVHIVLNHALIPQPDVELPDRYRDFDPEKELRLIYVGSIVGDRGGRKLAEMMTHVWKSYPQATLDLVGMIRPDSLERDLNKIANASDKRIRLHGFVDFLKARTLMQRAHIGMIPLLPNPNYTVSIATKFFDYMIYGLPCVASNFPLWEEFLRETQCGITADPTHSEALADAVVNLAGDKQKLLQCSETGYRQVRERFSWKGQAEKLFRIYKDIQP
ncbi:glycosyltransferase family 4 protein [bacterium]|nr:glycosyltransferase family 4 protein [bacterium]MBU1650573.1 glycosyltransferase family 4 protein [bacterium]MBU1880476.1 glycosyltransferase family 4 protein [bacterium]